MHWIRAMEQLQQKAQNGWHIGSRIQGQTRRQHPTPFLLIIYKQKDIHILFSVDPDAQCEL